MLSRLPDSPISYSVFAKSSVEDISEGFSTAWSCWYIFIKSMPISRRSL